jgi:hypothetical protein
VVAPGAKLEERRSSDRDGDGRDEGFGAGDSGVWQSGGAGNSEDPADPEDCRSKGRLMVWWYYAIP